jgi:ABC-type transporter Mla subunit MlaD
MTEHEQRQAIDTILEEHNAMAQDVIARSTQFKGVLQALHALIDAVDGTHVAQEQFLVRIVTANTAATALKYHLGGGTSA